jgi:TonB family protein
MFASPKRSALLSWLLHCGAILLILAVTGVKPQIITHLRDILVVPADIESYKTSAHSGGGGGGGGGGVHADSPASLGNPAPFARRQFSVPTVEIQNFAPILPMEPTLIGDPDIKPATFNYAQYGDPDGVLGKLSGGPGTGGGIGGGEGTGIGSGKGPGLGPGEGGGEGGGGVAYTGIGGGVTAPTLLSKTEPEYSEDARKARVQGTVLLRIEVNTHGQPQNISVRQSLGMGLDDRAIEAVKKWRFNPGKVNGKPAVVVAYVEVNFRLL